MELLMKQIQVDWNKASVTGIWNWLQDVNNSNDKWQCIRYRESSKGVVVWRLALFNIINELEEEFSR